jgi:Outer membrane protein beta-barrel domain
MKQVIFLIAAMLAAPFASGRAQAVMTRFGVEVASFYATVDGDDVELIDAGFGFDVQGRVAWPVWSIGLGWQRSTHEIDELETDVISTALFVEPRYHVPSPGAMTAYLLVRGGLAKDRFNGDVVDSGPAEVELSGFMIGLGAGMSWTASRVVNVSFSSIWTRDSFGDAKLNGQTVEDTKSKATHLSVRLGASIALPAAR